MIKSPIERIKAILADDKNYQADSLKIGAIWDVCDRAASYKRGKDISGRDFIEVLPPNQSLSLESVRSEALEIPSYESIAEMLPSSLSKASTRCPLCGQSGFHRHTPEEIVIYRNGIKYGRALHSPARVAEDKAVHSTELRK